MATRKTFLATLGGGAVGALLGYGARSPRSAQPAGEPSLPAVDVVLPTGYTAGRDPIDAYLADGVARARDRGAPLRIPPGTHLFEKAQVWEDLPGVVGIATLRPTSELHGATCITISTTTDESGSPPECAVVGLRIDGSLTRGATGLKVGGNQVSARIQLDNVRVQYFQHDGGVGLHLSDVVQAMIASSRFTRCDTNCLIDAADPALPTVASFTGTYFNHAARKGVRIVHGYTLKFGACVFEANGEEGTWIAPGAGENVLDAVFEDCWWEANHLDHAERAANYHFVALGTAAGATCEPRLIRPFFGGGNRAIRLALVSGAVIDAPRVPNVPGVIRIENAHSTGHVRNWNSNVGDQATLIANDSPHMRGIEYSGSAVVPGNGSFVTVNHRLGVSPSIAAIRVIPLSPLGAASHWWIANVNARSFDVVVDRAPGGSGAVFAWLVQL